MPLDGVTLAALVTELHSNLAGARINRIHQPGKNDIAFTLYNPQIGNFHMIWSADPQLYRLHLTVGKRANPSQAPAFCMVLRKYLEGGRIQAVEQDGWERVVRMTVTVINEFGDPEDKILVGEFMGKHSNIILLQDAARGIIIDALRKYGHSVSRYREILPGRIYVAPPPRKKADFLTCSYHDFAEAAWGDPNAKLGEVLFNVCLGFSPNAALNFCCAAGLDPEQPASECGEYEFSKLYQQVQNWMNNLLAGHTQGWYRSVVSGVKADFAAYPLQNGQDLFVGEAAPVNQVCDLHFQSQLASNLCEQQRHRIWRTVKNELDKGYKKKFLRLGDLYKAQENTKYKLWGELVTAYAYQLRQGQRETELMDFNDSEPVLITLDPRFTPIQNAQRFFKIYSKSRSAQKHLTDLLIALDQDLSYLETVLFNIEQAENLQEILAIEQELVHEGYLHMQKTKTGSGKRKTEKLEPRKFISADGLEIWVGRNNQQNDWLTLKTAASSDLWLHAQQMPGSHVLIRLPESMAIEDVPDASLLAAAEIAAYYSKGRGGSKVAVDYTFRSQVKKPPGAKPGLVTYDHYWTVLVEPRIRSERINDPDS